MADNKLSKRRQKNVQQKVEWEANATNPVGITCTLTKCRDLFSLATNSVNIFDEILGNLESLSKLQANFHKFARRVLDFGICAWLFVLLYTGPHDTTVKLLEEVKSAEGAAHLVHNLSYTRILIFYCNVLLPITRISSWLQLSQREGICPRGLAFAVPAAKLSYPPKSTSWC
jgi:hypothetical protein